MCFLNGTLPFTLATPLLCLTHPGKCLFPFFRDLVGGLFISWWQVRPSVPVWLMICCVAVQVIKHTIRAKPHPESQALGSRAALSHIHHTGLGHHSVCHTETVCRVSLVALDCLRSQRCNFKKAAWPASVLTPTFFFNSEAKIFLKWNWRYNNSKTFFALQGHFLLQTN